MKLLNFNKKEHPHGQAYFVPGGSSYVYRQDRKAFAKEGYIRNVVVYRAIREIVTSICYIDIFVKKNGEPLSDHESLELLKRPNPTQGKDMFFDNLFTDFLITGEMYVARFPEDKKTTELWPLNPLDIHVKPGKDGIPASFVHKVNNAEKVFPVSRLKGQSQVFQHKTYNPLNYWRGLSPLEAASLAADTNNAGLKWNWSLLDNGGRPSGIIKFPDKPAGEVLNRIREFFKKQIQGTKNAGEIPVLTGGAEWQSVDNSPRDMDYNSTMRETAKYIASAYGVPLPLIDNDASTFNNLEQAKERLYTDTVLPMFNKFLNHFGNWLLPQYGEGLEFCADLDSIPALETVRQRRFDRMINGIKNGLLSIDEAREEVGYEPVGGIAESLFVPSGSIPIQMAGFEDMEDEDKRLAVEMRSVGYSDEEIKAVMSA